MSIAKPLLPLYFLIACYMVSYTFFIFIGTICDIIITVVSFIHKADPEFDRVNEKYIPHVFRHACAT